MALDATSSVVEWLMTPDASGASLPSLADLIQRPAWMKVAACRGLGQDVFFPERGEKLDAARAICAGCRVAEECRAFATADVNLSGVWGGTSARQRRVLFRSVA